MYVYEYTHIFIYKSGIQSIVKIFYIFALVFKGKFENIDKWFSILHYIVYFTI